MNETNWLTCLDPTPMLRFLQDHRTSERKLRLLMCACCRQIWDLMPDPRSRAAVEVSDRYADGEATPRELARARGAAVSVKGGAATAAYYTANTKASGPLLEAFGAAESALARQAAQQARYQQAAASWEAAQEASQCFQAALIREVIGNPFRDYPLDPLWLAWEGGTVGHLARGIYQDRAFDRMPILGDALEEAGCDHDAILAHCRSGEEHTRGCWVVDLITDAG